MKLSPYDVVFLNEDMPDLGLTKGQQGVILDVYHSPSPAYEVEFCDKEGNTLLCLALSPDKLSQDLI
ncbi:MAG: DUF4926 domain-containing protein [Pantoea sp.]|nr:DUF4926 domain-containing protein [Pantoea sp.]